MSDQLLEIADALYALRLPEFTPARDAKAKELKGNDLAARVKALKKPSTAAWVVNLWVRREAEQVEQVLVVGESLRQAQAGMSADELRALTRQRRQLTAAVTQQARGHASEAGVRVTQAVADQVEATLTAAMVDESCGRAVRSGLLVTSLSSTGVDEVDLSAAVALSEALGFSASAREPEPAARPDLHVVPDPGADRKARDAAKAALDQATETVVEAKASHDAAVTEVEELKARQLQIEAEMDELKRKIAELETSCDDVDDALADAEDVRSEASDALHAATKERDAAAAAVERLG